MAGNRGTSVLEAVPGFDDALLPAAEEVAFYRTHGWFVTPPILAPALLDRAREACLRFYAGERDTPLPPVASALDWKPEKGETLRLNAYVSLQMRAVAELVHLPVLGAFAARLAGTPEVRLFRDALIYKPPAGAGEATRVGWHTDRAYWPTCTSDEMLTAWIPFEDVDLERGTLRVLDGSHRWPDNLEKSFSEQDMEGILGRLTTGGEQVEEVPLVLKKGQVSFHHCRTVHGSRENCGDRPRISLAVHMQDSGNRYRPRQNPDGTPVAHLNDLLCRKLPSGHPDYRDPKICPVLWRQA